MLIVYQPCQPLTFFISSSRLRLNFTLSCGLTFTLHLHYIYIYIVYISFYVIWTDMSENKLFVIVIVIYITFTLTFFISSSKLRSSFTLSLRTFFQATVLPLYCAVLMNIWPSSWVCWLPDSPPWNMNKYGLTAMRKTATSSYKVAPSYPS